MRSHAVRVAVAVGLGLIAWCAGPGAGVAQTPFVDVHAHRGGAGLAPENTLAAFRNALALGADVLEMDLHTSADGEVMVIHDATLNRTTSGRGAVRGATVVDLQRLDAGSWFNPRYAGERIPTLRDVLELVRTSSDARVRLNLETKYDQASLPPPDFEERVLRAVREAGMTGRIIIQSFHYPSLGRVKAIDAAIPTAALRAAADPAPDPVAVVREAGATMYSPSFRVVNRAAIQTLHASGIPVIPWTVNAPAEMERLLDAGIGLQRGDGIITDYPDRLIQVLRARGLRR